MTTTASDQALIALARLIKQVDFYPPGHPALETAVTQATDLLRQATAAGPLTLDVRRDGLQLQGRAVGAAAGQALARLLATRRIRCLRLEPDRSAADLIGLARSLSLPAEQLYLQGGLSRLLAQHQVQGILTDEASVRDASRGGDIEAAPVAPTTPPPPKEKTRDLRTLIGLLRSTPAPQWPPLLAELEGAARPLLVASPVPVALKLLPALIRLTQQRELTAAERRPLQQTIDRLCHDGVLAPLFDQLGLSDRSAADRAALTFVLAAQIERTLPPLLALYRTATAPQRQDIEQVLAARRPRVLEPLRAQLEAEEADQRLVAIRLLGALGDRLSIDRLSRLINDPHPDCARAALVALAQVGTPEAGDHLLVALRDERREIRLAAIAALGQMAYDAAIPPLVALVEKPDPWNQRLPERQAALEALGRIGGDRATQVLLRTLRRYYLRERVAEALQTAAVAGLSDQQHPDIVPALEKALKHRSLQVRRMARQILNRRQERHGPPTT